MVLYKFTMLSSAWQRLTLEHVRRVIPVRYHESVKLMRQRFFTAFRMTSGRSEFQDDEQDDKGDVQDGDSVNRG